VSFEDFLNKLDPKDAKALKTASTAEVVKIPTASRRLNLMLGGGIPRGMITTIYGNPSAGKSMLCLQSIAGFQKMGLVCGYVDAERTLDSSFAKRLGVNTDELVLDGSKSSDKIEIIIKKWIAAGIDVIVVDSISDIMPAVFVDDKTGEMSDNRRQIGAHAKAVTNLLNGIHYVNEDTAVIIISQTTTKLEQTYVKQVPHGGKKTEFGSSVMLQLTSSNTDAKQKKGIIMKGGVKQELPIGRTVKAFTEKNKTAPAHRSCEYDIYYDGDFIGIDSIGELADMCAEFGVINKSAAWFKLDEERKWQGRDSLVNAIRQDVRLENELETLLEKVWNG
jgi:recombination protein RecA